MPGLAKKGHNMMQGPLGQGKKKENAVLTRKNQHLDADSLVAKLVPLPEGCVSSGRRGSSQLSLV